MTLRFPAVRIASQAEFDAWAHNERPIFDQRWLYEQQQIKAGLSSVRAGTCGLCLAPTVFRSEAPAHERNWREELRCGCAMQLSNRERAILHFLHARGAIAPGRQLALTGRESQIEAKLSEWGHEVLRLPRLLGGRLRFDAACIDLLICADYLQQVPPVVAFMREVARVIRPSGDLCLTVPFDVNALGTRSRVIDLPRSAVESAVPLHLFGWDLLDLLRDLGFADVAANFYWSDEFGYLGPFNMIISAVRCE